MLAHRLHEVDMLRLLSKNQDPVIPGKIQYAAVYHLPSQNVVFAKFLAILKLFDIRFELGEF